MTAMRLPIDLEDVAQMAVGSVFQRFMLLYSSLMCGTVMAFSSIWMSSMVEEAWDWMHGRGFAMGSLPELSELVAGLLFGFFAGMATPLFPAYALFLMWLIVHFMISDEIRPKAWVGGAGVVGLNVTGAAWGDLGWWCALALVFCGVLIAGLAFLAKWWAMVLRIRAEEHFIGVAAENEAKRLSLQERNGPGATDQVHEEEGEQP